MTQPETDLIGSYPKVCKVIRKCSTMEQLDSAKQYVALYIDRLPYEAATVFRDDLHRLIEYQTLSVQSQRRRTTNEIPMDSHS